MTMWSFTCPECGAELESDEQLPAGTDVVCPSCSASISVSGTPIADSAADGAEQPTRECPSCGAALNREAVLCVSCGYDKRSGRQISGATGQGVGHAPKSPELDFVPPRQMARSVGDAIRAGDSPYTIICLVVFPSLLGLASGVSNSLLGTWEIANPILGGLLGIPIVLAALYITLLFISFVTMLTSSQSCLFKLIGYAIALPTFPYLIAGGLCCLAVVAPALYVGHRLDRRRARRLDPASFEDDEAWMPCPQCQGRANAKRGWLMILLIVLTFPYGLLFLLLKPKFTCSQCGYRFKP